MTQTVTITGLRKNIFDLLAAVDEKGRVLEVKKDGKKIVTISKYVEKKFNLDKYIKEMRKAREKLSVNFDYKGIKKARIDSKKERFPEW